jgi:hypothetical protein
MTKKLCGRGFDLLKFFSVDYNTEITDELMQNPNAQFQLQLDKIPRVKK